MRRALRAPRLRPAAEWLDELLPDGPSPARPSPCSRPLAVLRDAAAPRSPAREMEFEPLLPDDDAPLDERVEALGAWCQGFLYGFGAAGHGSSAARCRRTVAEVLADLAEVAQAGGVGSESRRGRRGARYAELVEFVRVGVQLVYDELAALRAAPASPNRH